MWVNPVLTVYVLGAEPGIFVTLINEGENLNKK